MNWRCVNHLKKIWRNPRLQFLYNEQHFSWIYNWYPLHFGVIFEVSISIEIRTQNKRRPPSHEVDFNTTDYAIVTPLSLLYEISRLLMIIYILYKIFNLVVFLFQYVKQIPEFKKWLHCTFTLFKKPFISGIGLIIY